ncbi:MAG TPA: ethanolamine ammonia-lyase subunit EutB, partial [Fibrella sp.]
MYRHTIGQRTYTFADLKTLLARASPRRSGDELAELVATSAEERVAAQMTLADLPLDTFLNEAVIPYEQDEVTRLIIDTHDAVAFADIRHLTVGGLRDFLLAAQPAQLTNLHRGLTPEMVAAVSKLMRNQDLISVARNCHIVTQFRNTLGGPGRFHTRLQPNHPTDDLRGITASLIDGLCYGSGDAVIGVNPATDNVPATINLLRMLDQV